jgi:hypothetical protein
MIPFNDELRLLAVLAANAAVVVEAWRLAGWSGVVVDDDRAIRMTDTMNL